VLDTNSLLHYKLPSEIDWPTVFGYSEVRLVIPRAVIDELDRKKWEGADRIRKKARAVLPRLERLLAADGSPREILPGVTLEALVEPGPRERPEDADEAILAVCIELAQFSGAPQPVTLVTADTGLRIRATQEGITAVGLPDSARRDPG
jgi:predicted ribonuclease YlaK